LLWQLGVWQLAASLAACAPSGGDAEKAVKSDVQAVVGARTATAAVGVFPLSVTALGTVAPRPGRYAAMSAPAPTRVAQIFVAAGQAVEKGAPLIAFERAPFDAAARSAQAAVTTAQHAHDRAVRLAQAGILPQKDVDQAAGDLAQAQAALVTAQRAQELATLQAPLSGVVTRISAVVGASVDVSQPLVEIADPSALDIVFSLTPSEVAPVRVGQAVAFWAGEAARGEALGTGAVSAVAAAVDSATRAVEVRVRVTRSGRSLKIGESAFGRIAVGAHPRAVTVPLEALVPDGDGFKVFVVDVHGIAHAQPVTVGARSEALAEVTAGLSGGETVVTYGAFGVEDSAKIVPAKP
jgi:membrane fusion protein (multidrug efflux system)